MTKSKLWIVIGVLIGLVVVVYAINFYFLSHLSGDANAVDGEIGSHGRHSKSSYAQQVRKRVKLLKPNYLNRNPRFYGIRNKIWRNFEPQTYENVTNVWDIAYWVNGNLWIFRFMSFESVFQFIPFLFSFAVAKQ